jgi:hypothetical protein
MANVDLLEHDLHYLEGVQDVVSRQATLVAPRIANPLDRQQGRARLRACLRKILDPLMEIYGSAWASPREFFNSALVEQALYCLSNLIRRRIVVEPKQAR